MFSHALQNRDFMWSHLLDGAYCGQSEQKQKGHLNFAIKPSQHKSNPVDIMKTETLKKYVRLKARKILVNKEDIHNIYIIYVFRC